MIPKTTATNKKIRVLLTDIKAGTLVPRPEFQRRLVWTNKHKLAFLDTVLKQFPFPEIYIAASEINPDTGEGKEMLVDGQQRITTLYQYFTASPDLDLSREIDTYANLNGDQKRNFLEYEVVIRDLGAVSIETIKEVFERINSTRYSLNAMEVHNSRYDGEMKKFAEEISSDSFFDEHRVFSANDVKRMHDVRFALTIIVTIMGTYFHRDEELEKFLIAYNDEMDSREELGRELHAIFAFIEGCGFDRDSRVWKKADLFTLLVELHRAIYKNRLVLRPGLVGPVLSHFYNMVSDITQVDPAEKTVLEYSKYSIQGTNDRTSRIVRGQIIAGFLEFTTKNAV